MAYTDTALLFTTAPVDTGDTPGYAPGTKAYGFAESLTSARLNRLPYALALNIDDVNARLISLIFQHNVEMAAVESRLDVVEPQVDSHEISLNIFEASGLDAAYRLGAVNTPGGGRLITTDGGAVEIDLAHTALYEHDPANAALRLRSDQIADDGGAVLLDMVSSEPPGAGDASVSMIHRQVFSGGAGANFPPGSSATLNPGGGAASTIRLTTGTTGHPSTNIYHTHDLVEIFGGSNPGLYRVVSVDSPTDISLGSLDGANASFGADDSVTATLFRSRILAGLTSTLVLQENESFPQDVLYIRSRVASPIKVVSGSSGAGATVFDVGPQGDVVAAGDITAQDNLVATNNVTGDNVIALTDVTAQNDVVATTDFRYASTVTQKIVPSVTGMDSLSNNVLFEKVNHGYNLVMDTGFAAQETVYLYFDLPIPEGAIIDTLKIGMGKIVNAGGTVIMQVTSLRQAILNMNAIGHGSNVSDPTSVTIGVRNTGPDEFELSFNQQKASTLPSMGAVHSKENYYWLQLTFGGLESFTNIHVNFPEITYTFDTL